MFLLCWSPNSLWLVISTSTLLLFGFGEGSISVSNKGDNGPWNSESPHPTTAPDSAFAKFRASLLKAGPDETGCEELDPIPKHLRQQMKGFQNWDWALLVQDEGAKCPLKDKALNAVAHGYTILIIVTQAEPEKAASREKVPPGLPIFITFVNQATGRALVRSDMKDCRRCYISIHVLSLLRLFVAFLFFGSVPLLIYVIICLWRWRKSKAYALHLLLWSKSDCQSLVVHPVHLLRWILRRVKSPVAHPLKKKKVSSSCPPPRVMTYGGNVWDACFLCFQVFKEGERVCVLGCGHAFHARTNCTDRWIVERRNICSICVFKAGNHETWL